MRAALAASAASMTMSVKLCVSLAHFIVPNMRCGNSSRVEPECQAHTFHRFSTHVMVSITVKPRGGKSSKRFPVTVQLDTLNATVRELKQAIATKSKVRPSTAQSKHIQLLLTLVPSS